MLSIGLILILCLSAGSYSASTGKTKGILQRVCNNRGPVFQMNLHNQSPFGIPRTTNVKNIPKSGKACTPIDETVGLNNGEENAMWYFREDMLLNAGHIFWHMSHPQNLLTPEVPLDIDRRGEMFCYFHRNIMARYDTERISNGLPRVVPIVYEEGTIILQGYDPHLLEAPHEYRYPPRLDNMVLMNVTESREVQKVLEADIDRRELIAKIGNLSITLDTIKGIDYLGELIESSINSVNDERYSRIGIHSSGHKLIGSLHEYIGEDEGDDLVCGCIFNPATAMRDTVFYEWHKNLDDVFYRHTALMKPHHPTEGEFPLIWSGVSVDSVEVQSVFQSNPNSLRTFFNTHTIEIPLTEDIFFANVTHEYCMKRLEHEEFEYNITINKQAFVQSSKATVRIFMSSRFNQTGGRWSSLTEQNRMFFALDSFVVDLTVGQNIVSRKSSASNLLSKWKLETWNENPPSDDIPECGCGWPSHLLLPKGNTDGMIFDLFVMVTDAEIDVPIQKPVEKEGECSMGVILCGIQDMKYPDVRPMGYPFDTRPFEVLKADGELRDVTNLEEYVSMIPNSKAIQVVIKHYG